MKKSPGSLKNITCNSIPVRDVFVADNYWLRLRGLVGRPVLKPGEGLWIVPCQQVHTQFMKVPLDLVFLDKQLVVKRVLRGIRPWRFSPWVRDAHSVLELTASTKLDIQEGDQLKFE